MASTARPRTATRCRFPAPAGHSIVDENCTTASASARSSASLSWSMPRTIDLLRGDSGAAACAGGSLSRLQRAAMAGVGREGGGREGAAGEGKVAAAAATAAAAAAARQTPCAAAWAREQRRDRSFGRAEQELSCSRLRRQPRERQRLVDVQRRRAGGGCARRRARRLHSELRRLHQRRRRAVAVRYALSARREAWAGRCTGVHLRSWARTQVAGTRRKVPRPVAACRCQLLWGAGRA